MWLLLACSTESGAVYKIRARVRGTESAQYTLEDLGCMPVQPSG